MADQSNPLVVLLGKKEGSESAERNPLVLCVWGGGVGSKVCWLTVACLSQAVFESFFNNFMYCHGALLIRAGENDKFEEVFLVFWSYYSVPRYYLLLAPIRGLEKDAILHKVKVKVKAKVLVGRKTTSKVL